MKEAKRRREERGADLAPAAAIALEACVVRLCFSTSGGFRLALRVCHPLLNAIENFLLGETGILEVGYRAHGHGTNALEAPVEQIVSCGRGKAHGVKHDGIASDGVVLIGLSDLKDLCIGKSAASKIPDGIRSDKRMLVLMGDAHKRNDGLFVDIRFLEANDFGDFGIAGI